MKSASSIWPSKGTLLDKALILVCGCLFSAVVLASVTLVALSVA